MCNIVCVVITFSKLRYIKKMSHIYRPLFIYSVSNEAFDYCYDWNKERRNKEHALDKKYNGHSMVERESTAVVSATWSWAQ